jgi:flavodoxin
VVTKKLLVAYVSKHGSTREVAEAIAETLEKAAHEVELRRAADIEDPTPYDGVVLGGSLYFGRWHDDAVRFLSKHRRKLSELPLAVFALGQAGWGCATGNPQSMRGDAAQSPRIRPDGSEASLAETPRNRSRHS